MQLATTDIADRLSLPEECRQHLPVEVHCHGFGPVDFSDLAGFDLGGLELACHAEGVLALPTLYLHRERLEDFERLVREFACRRDDGDLKHIAGIALEGPLLASHGGTPTATVWSPTMAEWARLAALGEYGLVYTVMSPDVFSPESELHGASDGRFSEIIPMLTEHGVRPALGHFTRADPARSAAQVDELVELAWSNPYGGRGRRVITDHLFNDMPLRIRHAFRTSRARAQRDQAVASYDLPGWQLDNLEEILGPVPAAIIRQAAAGRIAACINFDGEHVDLDIARRAVELMGFENSMIMTDRCDSARLGGQQLHHETQNSLWYQEDGIVAAGSQPLARQIDNASSTGLGDQEVWQLVSGTAHAVFGLEPVSADRAGTVMAGAR